MESDLRSEVSLSRYESVIENIAMLKKEIHNKIISFKEYGRKYSRFGRLSRLYKVQISFPKVSFFFKT